MKRRIVKRVLLLFGVLVIGFAIWTFWVPDRDPGGREMASGWAYLLMWSPDGRYIQYYYRDYDTSVDPFEDGTVIARADGSGAELRVTAVAPGAWREQPLSPVVCETLSSWPDYEVRLIAVDLDAEQLERLEPRFALRWGGRCAVAPSLSQAARCLSTPDLSKVQLLLLSGDGSQRVLRVYPGLPYIESAREVYWSPDEKTLAVVGPGQIDVVDIATGSSRTLLRVSGGPSQLSRRVSWLPDGKEIAIAFRDSDVPARFLDWANNVSAKCITRRTGWMRKPAGFFYDRREKRIRSVVCSVRVRDGKVRELFRLPRRHTVSDIAWSPDGSQLAAVCDRRDGPDDESTIRVFDTPKAKPADWRPAEEVLGGSSIGPDSSKG